MIVLALLADVDRGKIFCIDVPQDYTTERQYVFTVVKLLLYRHALRCANALGKHWVERATRTVHLDHTAHTYQRVEEYRIKPHEFRGLPDHTAVVRHCTNGFKKVCLRPA